MLAELRQAEQRETESMTALRYEFKVKRKRTGYTAHSEQYGLRTIGKDLHSLLDSTYEALDLHLATIGGPFVNPNQLHFTLL
jgi:hypothetical protein